MSTTQLTSKDFGFRHIVECIERVGQEHLVDAVAEVVREAPLYRPTLPRSGRPMSVMMTNCGELGWFTDRKGYRYEGRHPETGRPWPPIPARLLKLWSDVTDCPAGPEACLINHYAADARMGVHRDEDEDDFAAPVVSISLGDECLFRIGGLRRRDPTSSMRLRSGDVVVLGGNARLAFHGVDRIYGGTSDLLERYPDLFPGGGRINLTLRRVTKVAS